MIHADEKSILDARAAQLPTRRANYKAMHSKTAEKKGVLREFLAATTLTQMRRILFG